MGVGVGGAGGGDDGMGEARFRKRTSVSILPTVGHHGGRLRLSWLLQQVNILVCRGIPRLHRLGSSLLIRIHSLIHAPIALGEEIDSDFRSNPRQVVNIGYELMDPIDVRRKHGARG